MLLILMGACLLCSFVCAALLFQDVFGITFPRRRRYKELEPRAGLQRCLRWLNDEKRLPIASGGRWQIWGHYGSLRLWCHRLSEEKCWPTVFALSVRIKASSQHLFGFIKDVERFGEWRCNQLEVVRHAPVSGPADVDAAGAGSRTSASVACSGADCLTLTRLPLTGRCALIDTFLSAVLPARCQVFDRCWQTEQNNAHWILECGRRLLGGVAKKSEATAASQSSQLPDFTFFLMQPVISRENDQSVLTVITTRAAFDMAQDVCCISDYFLGGRSHVLPLGPLLTYPSCLGRPTPSPSRRVSGQPLAGSADQQTKSPPSLLAASRSSDTPAATPNAVVSSPTARNTNNSSSLPSSSAPAVIVKQSQLGSDSSSVRQTAVSPPLVGSSPAPTRRIVAASDSVSVSSSGGASHLEDSGEYKPALLPFRRTTEPSESHSQADQPPDVVESDEAAEIATTAPDCEQHHVSPVSADDEEVTREAPSSGPPGDHLAQPSQLSVFYVPLLPSAAESMALSLPSAPDDVNSSLSMASATGSPRGILLTAEQGLIDYRTLSNQCAADVIAEVIRASNITPQLRRRHDDEDEAVSGGGNAQTSANGSGADSAASAGSGPSALASSYGWTFQYIEKDVVILRKHGTDPRGCTESWLGKGLIKSSPDAVWRCVSNPKTRFLYDELLKAADVVSDMGGGMKLIRLYYEASHLLRRKRGTGVGGADSHEFYVLQSERLLDSDKEPGRRLLCLHSVDCPEPPLKDTPRGTFYSSGWLVEPVPRKDRRSGYHTMVTYLSQIQLNSDAAVSLHEEIVAKQPLGISALREYLALPVAAV